MKKTTRDDKVELEAATAALAQKVDSLTRHGDGYVRDLPNMLLRRIDTLTEQSGYLHEPSICLTVSGAKRVLLGEEVFVYDTRHYLLSSLDLPVMAQVIEKPYLGIMLRIDMDIVATLIADTRVAVKRGSKVARGMTLSEVTLPLINAFGRLVELLEDPADIPILTPIIQQEIIYRLLISEQGLQLRQLILNQSHKISHAISWLKNHFAEPFKVGDLAEYVSMSNSSFHHHFRSLTAMTPLQYQKKLRLHEAKKLMLVENYDAASAAFEVGYESPSQFNREYNRLFGTSPMRDIRQLRGNAG